LQLIGFVGATCPNCGKPLELRQPRVEADLISVKIPIAQYLCDDCGATFVLDPSGRCPHCGSRESPKGSPDKHASARQNRWQAQVTRITRNARSAVPARLRFSSRGTRKDVRAHVNWLHEDFFVVAMSHFKEAKELLSATSWAELGEPADSALNQIEAHVAAIVHFVEEAQSTPPPPILLSIHRGTARAAGSLVQSIALFTQVIVASHFESAKSLGGQAQASIDDAASVAVALDRQLEIVKSVSAEPGWFAWDESFDPGRATTELLLKRPGNVADAASLVRSTFSGVRQIAELPDPVAFTLAPTALAAALWDPVRLERRINSVLRVLTDATSRNPNWIGDPSPFISALLRGHSQLSEQIGILGFLARSSAPRKTLLMGAVGVYQKFTEGPLRRLGAIIRQAEQVSAGRQDHLDAEALEEDHLGKVIESLQQVSSVVVPDVPFLVRNADAHYEFEVIDGAISVTEPKRNGKKRADLLTDDDFFELLFNLNELVVAFEAALLAYIATEAPGGLMEELTRATSGRDQQYEAIRALAGLRGWVELSFVYAGDLLSVDGRYIGDRGTNPFLELLSTVAGIFGALMEVRIVEVTERGTGLRLDYSRDTIGEQTGLAATLQAGRAMAYVTRKTDPPRRITHDARYVLLGPLAVLLDAVANQELSMHDLQDLCLWTVSWLPSEDIDRSLMSDRDRIVSNLTALSQAIAVSEIAAKSHERSWVDRTSQVIRDRLIVLAKDRQRLQSLYS